MMRTATIAVALGLGVCAPIYAQSAPAGPDDARVRQVIVYGDDPCPVGEGDEILVCARQEEKDRYRIPKELRGEEIGSTKNEAWTSRVRSIEYVGVGGTQSCSPVGSAGFSGCFSKIAKQAKAERQGLGDKSWSDLVAAERAKRLGTIDADSQEIEARVKAEEKAKAASDAQAGGDTTAAPMAEEK